VDVDDLDDFLGVVRRFVTLSVILVFIVVLRTD
jgi:hypothetical protein